MDTNQTTIICSKCGNVIELNEALTWRVRKAMEMEFELKMKEREAVIERQANAEKVKMWDKAQEKAKELNSKELDDLKNQVLEKEKRLEDARKFEIWLRQRQRELEDQKRDFELQVQRKMDEERKRIKEESDSEFKKKLLEKEQQLAQMTKKIEDLKKNSEQGSMQIQWDSQEVSLKKMIQMSFPIDIVEDVPTWIKWADLIQTVNNNFGQKCGVIIWESKNTKVFSREWLKKLSDDKQGARADFCILVTQALPVGIERFGYIDEVWISDFRSSLGLATALRLNLIHVFNLLKSFEWKDEKMEMVYNYLSWSQFKNRIDSVVTTFNGMRTDLDAEKRAIQKIWAKREKEIDRVISSVSWLYGDLQGISWWAIATIQSLELPTWVEDVEGDEL